jgi:hypothetical protein
MGRGEVTDNRWRRAHGQLAEGLQSTRGHGIQVEERAWTTGEGQLWTTSRGKCMDYSRRDRMDDN